MVSTRNRKKKILFSTYIRRHDNSEHQGKGEDSKTDLNTWGGGVGLTKVWKPGCYQAPYKVEDDQSDVFRILREVDFELGFVNDVHPAIERRGRENDFFFPRTVGNSESLPPTHLYKR